MASGIRRKSAPSRLVISDVHSDSPCQECILCKSKQHVYTHPLKWKDQSLFTYLRDIEPEMSIDATACICRNCKADLANGKKDPAHYHPWWTARTPCDTPCEVPNYEDPACRSTKQGPGSYLSTSLTANPKTWEKLSCAANTTLSCTSSSTQTITSSEVHNFGCNRWAWWRSNYVSFFSGIGKNFFYHVFFSNAMFIMAYHPGALCTAFESKNLYEQAQSSLLG